MRGHLRPEFVPAREDVAHARGEDVLQKLTDLEHAERSEGRWLEDDRVARGERRRDFPDRQIDREIQRRDRADDAKRRSEEHTSELQSLMRISYAVFCFKKNKPRQQ